MLVLGYADQEPPYLKGRLCGPGVVHRGKYHRLTPDELDELVATYDDPSIHLGLSDGWREEGMAHYLDWFYTVWLSRGGPKAGKSQMQELIERAGLVDK
jgi:hypothetical protein